MKLPLIKGTRVDSEAEWRDSIPRNLVGFSQQVGDWSGYLRTADGLKAFGTGFGPDRGALWSDRFNQHYRVSGDRLVTVDQFGGTSDIGGGTLIPGSGPARFANSFNSVAFTANGSYYRWNGTALANVTKPVGAGAFIDMVWIDGYYIFCDTENLWNTTLANEALFGANERSGSDFAPDQIVGLGRSSDNKLVVFNRYSTERFYNAAGPLFPFARIPNAAIPIGIVGTDAKASIGDGAWIVFGGSKEYSPSFYMLTNSYQNISTKEIDSIIDGYSDFELSRMKIEYRDTRDQALVICHLPRNTLVYDITLSRTLGMNIWYEWTSADESPWRAIYGVYDPRNVDNTASSWIYGDKTTSDIAKLDTTICTQYGEIVEWSCRTPLVKIGGTVREAEIVTAPGHNNTADAKLFVATTKDGVLFGPPAIVNRGKPGEYQKRLIVRRLGDYPNWFGMRISGFSAEVTSITGVEIQ